jgi:hypothetical protein
MSTKVEHGTAGECARQLLDAVNSGSHARVHEALHGIADLASAGSSDSQELEFRDLLAGIVEPISAAVPEFLSAPNAPSKQAVMRMLVHVAGGVSD